MSAIRTTTNRADARKKRSAPYGRSMVSTVLRFFGFPIGEDGGRGYQSEGDTMTATPSANVSASSSPHNNRNYTPQQQQFPSSCRPPLTPARSGNFPTPPTAQGSSNVPDAQSVASFFSQRLGTNISSNVVESMVTDLQVHPPEPGFRFTFTTPSRDSSPSAPSNVISLNSTTPSRKRLSKNPNGVYRWEGAGSAKRATPRNRYASPAFGASPSKREPPKMPATDTSSSAETSTPDNKRRKVDNPSTSSSASGASQSTSTIPFPLTASPTSPRTNGVNSRPNGAPPAPSLPRTAAKPNAPVNPSPLRQTWSQASSASSRDEIRKSPSQQTKQSDTANFMAELIKETTPVKKPDISNPYQTSHATGKVIQPRPKKPRAVRRQEEDKKKVEEEKQKEKEKLDLKDYSPQAIIEATLPVGSKRSRPPAHFEKSPSTSGESSASTPPVREAPIIVETKKITYVVEEADDDEDGGKRSMKRSKPSINGRGSVPKKAPSYSDITVEEVDDVVLDVHDKGKEKEPAKPVEAAKSTTNVPPVVNGSGSAPRTPFLGFKPTSVPKEPSKLRNSIVAEGSSAPSTPAPAPALPLKPAPSPLSFQSLASSNTGFTFTAPGSGAVKENQPPSVGSIKSQARGMPVFSLPAFDFTSAIPTPVAVDAEHIKARAAAKALPASSLPQYDSTFGFSAEGFSFDYDPSKPKPYPTSSSSKPSPPQKANPNPNPFLTNSTTASPAAANLFGSNMFGTKTTAPAPAPVQGFNWAAAGIKAPETPKNQWKCTVCCATNADSAKKCIACEEPAPRRGSEANDMAEKITTPVVGFNWGAAGMKAPEVPKDKWSCSSCGLSNPLSASKCEICDNPK